MLFNSIVGHSRQLSLLRRLAESNSFPQSSIFVGPEGVGKKTIAKELLTRLTGSFLNVKVVGVEKPASVDQIRETSSWLFTKPSSGDGKAVIIDRADDMRVEAANALLKTLEEPPSYGYICLIARGEESLLPTIRSRCRVFRFGPLPESSVSYLLDKMGFKVDKRVVKFSRGSIGMALKLLETPAVDLLEEFLSILREKRGVEKVVSFGEKFGKLSREDTLIFFDLLEAVVFEKGGIPRWEDAINRARYFLRFYGKPQSVVEWFLMEIFSIR